jgi:membrane protein implicated in regulation of membrane protease activity
MDVTLLIVVIVGILNLIALYAMKDWNAIAVFLLAGTVTFFFTQNSIFMLVAAMVAASLFRASKMMEGLENKQGEENRSEEEKTEKEDKEGKAKEEPKPNVEIKNQAAMSEGMGDFVEPLSSQFEGLQQNNEVLMNNIQALKPLLKQSAQMMKMFTPEMMTAMAKNFGKINSNP